MPHHPHPFISLPTSAACAALVCAMGLSGAALAQTGSGGKDGKIEKCENNLGTLAVSEPQSHMLASLGQFKLGSPSTMLRMIAQESGCFTVVERGVGMQNIQQERALAAGGMLQQGANVGGGQLQAADFVITPSLQFSDNTGGVGGAVGGLLGRMGGTLGALGGLVGGLKFKEAETTLLLADVRSGIQVASAEGKASKMDFSLGGWGWGGFGWAAAGGYSKTPEGKLLAASLLDNYNRIVQQVRNNTSLVQASSASSRANAQSSTVATPLAAPLAPLAVVVQPTTVVVPPTSAAPAPVSLNAPSSGALSAADQMIEKAAGYYAGQLTGLLTGPLTLFLSSDGMLHCTVNLSDQPVLALMGQINSNNGDFMLSGNSKLGTIMVVGKLDLSAYTAQGNWFVSQSSTSAPSPGGQLNAKR